MELALIERNVEIEGGINGSASEIFCDDIGVRRKGCVLYSDGVQGFKGVNKAKRFAILFKNAKPATVV